MTKAKTHTTDPTGNEADHPIIDAPADQHGEKASPVAATLEVAAGVIFLLLLAGLLGALAYTTFGTSLNLRIPSTFYALPGSAVTVDSWTTSF